MGLVHLPDVLQQVIDRQVAEGHAASEAEFINQAVRRYAEELDDVAIAAAADKGIADIEAGRFTMVSGRNDLDRLHAELNDRLDSLAEQHGPADR